MEDTQSALLLTLLNAQVVAAYTAAGFWGDETIYRSLRGRRWRAEARGSPPSLAAELCRAGGLPLTGWPRTSPAVASAPASASPYGCRAGSRPPSRCSPARATAMSAARRCIATTRSAKIVALVDRMRAAALIAQPGYGADADRHDVFAELADRDFLRCVLASRPGRRVRWLANCRPRRSKRPEQGRQPSDVSALHLRHDRRAERRYAQRQHAARNGADDARDWRLDRASFIR